MALFYNKNLKSGVHTLLLTLLMRSDKTSSEDVCSGFKIMWKKSFHKELTGALKEKHINLMKNLVSFTQSHAYISQKHI